MDVTQVHYVPGNAIALDAGYGPFGNRSTLDLTDAGIVYPHAWQFDDEGRLEQATFPGTGTTLPGPPATLDFLYYDNDDLRHLSHGNGATTAYTYHPNGPVDTITVADASATQLHRLDYTLDARLNVTAIAEEVGTTPLAPDWSYGYDRASRLTSATYPVVPGLADPLPVGEQLFPYDDAGNRDDDPTDPSPWAYNENNEIEASPELRYEFDADGTLCKWVPSAGSITTGCAAGDADETRFTFDPSNRLRRIDRPDGSVVTYRYDPFGRRLEKTVSGVTTWFVWDGDQLLGEYGASGNRQTRYVYAGGFAPVQVGYPNGSGGEDVQEVHSNHLETPRMLSDATGSAAWRSHLEAYGRAHVESPGGVVFNVRFPGQLYDAESERWEAGAYAQASALLYNRHRRFSPESGRYASREPAGQSGINVSAGLSEMWFPQAPGAQDIRFAGTPTNAFSYALNNPIGLTDPRGEWVAQAIGLGVGAAVGAAAAARAGGDRSAIARSAVVGALAGLASTLPIPGLPAALGSGIVGGVSGAAGNLATQVVVGGSPIECLDFGSAAISGLAGAAGGGLGAGLAGAKTPTFLSPAPAKAAFGPLFTETGQDAVSAGLGGLAGGGLDGLLQ